MSGIGKRKMITEQYWGLIEVAVVMERHQSALKLSVP